MKFNYLLTVVLILMVLLSVTIAHPLNEPPLEKRGFHFSNLFEKIKDFKNKQNERQEKFNNILNGKY